MTVSFGASAAPPSQDQGRAEGSSAAEEPPQVELGLGTRLAARGDGEGSVDYETSWRYSAHATIWPHRALGIRLTGGMEYLTANVPPGSLELEGGAENPPTLQGPHVVLELQPTWRVAQRWDLFGLVGVGWQRFTADAFELGEPTPLRVSERAGVVVEMPLSFGGRLALGESGWGVSLLGTLAVPVNQSGALFDSTAGAAQSVRQDTSELENVAAFQRFGLSYGAAASIDLQLY